MHIFVTIKAVKYFSRRRWHGKLTERCQQYVHVFYSPSTDWNQGLCKNSRALLRVGPFHQQLQKGSMLRELAHGEMFYCILYIRVFYFEQFYCTLLYGSLCIL